MLRWLASLVFLTTTAIPVPEPEPWGHVKGQVVRNGGGVRWVFVALVDPKDPNAVLPVHPQVAKTLPKRVLLAMLPGQFEPRCLGLVAGQTLLVTNTSAEPLNMRLQDTQNPTFNRLLQAGESFEVAGWQAVHRSMQVVSDLRPPMQGYLRVHAHPYFRVTDGKGNFEIKNAPAGEWNLIVWHEDKGYGPGGKRGVPVTITAGKVLEQGVVKLD